MLCDELKRLRKERKLTQNQLADALQVSQSTITSWENGTRQPTTDFIPTIATFYGISVDKLLGMEPESATVQDEAWAIRERLRRDPSYRLLFDAADKASPEHLRAAAAMLKALNPEEENEE